jgi:hypothetical protein
MSGGRAEQGGVKTYLTGVVKEKEVSEKPEQWGCGYKKFGDCKLTQLRL